MGKSLKVATKTLYFDPGARSDIPLNLVSIEKHSMARNDNCVLFLEVVIWRPEVSKF